MAEKVYVITRGAYSDYRILGVSLDKDRAKAKAEILRAEVEEWNPDQGLDELQAGLRTFFVEMDREGEVTRSWSGLDGTYTDGPKVSKHRNPLKRLVHGVVWARDMAHAVKIVGEFRARAKAEGRLG